jgi:dihydrofolate reductase
VRSAHGRAQVERSAGPSRSTSTLRRSSIGRGTLRRGKDVRLGGGATTIRHFLAAGLVDTMHVAVSPVELGSGARLWESSDELRDRFHLEVVPSPSGVTRQLFWRR